WASSLRYHKGKFYIMFNTLDEGTYLLTATDPEGEWTLEELPGTYYDPGLLFDDNGKIYVVHGIDELKVTELDENFEAVNSGQTVIERPDEGLEGSHFYKIDDYYYIYATYGGWPASQVVFRSEDVYGPYEEKFLLEDDNIHQGGLVETQTGEWWTVLFYDKGAYGRLPNLQPVTWEDNWPEIGVDGEGVETYQKPDVGREYPVEVLPTNDNFRNFKLGHQWGWNHNPDNSKWSLIDRPDFLRLETVNVAEGFLDARNTLTQRIFGYHSDTIDSYGTIKMHIDHMKEGDIAGLAVFQDPYAYIGVTVSDGEKRLIMENDGDVEMGSTVEDSVIYLRAVANYGTSKANFYYSTDNETYNSFGSELDMAFDMSIFTGNKFCIFNFATEETGGYVDVDWFSTEEEFSEDQFYDDSFEGYSEEQLTLDTLYAESDTIRMLIETTETLNITAQFEDGHTEDVTRDVSFFQTDPEVVDIANGRVIAKNNGETTITASYEGKMGETRSIELDVEVMTFPLVSGLFDPSIWEEGTFDEETGELITGTYGFGGWQYDNGIDLSGHEYLVVQLREPTSSGASFRIFDENSYWSEPYSYEMGSESEIIVDLDKMKKEVEDEMVDVDPSHIYIIGFWSEGGDPILIEDVFLSNSDEYDTSIEEVRFDEIDPNDIVDVYSITGVMLRSERKRKNATTGLPIGVYIVGNEEEGYRKVVVGNSVQ
ncbi:MAG: family 43 glycosylhydrolase, partial [Marinilabiliaceae bacterium]